MGGQGCGSRSAKLDGQDGSGICTIHAICLKITWPATDEWGNQLDHSYYVNDEDGDGGHAAGGEKMVMVALRNPSKCLWTLKLFKPTSERRQAAALQHSSSASWGMLCTVERSWGCKSW